MSISSAKYIQTKIQSLEEEIKFLKANFIPQNVKRNKSTGIASLEGLWHNKTNFSYEDIKSAEIKIKDL